MSNKRNFVLTKWFKQNWMFLWYVIMSIQFWRAHLGQFISTQQLLEIIFDTTSEKLWTERLSVQGNFNFQRHVIWMCFTTITLLWTLFSQNIIFYVRNVRFTFFIRWEMIGWLSFIAIMQIHVERYLFSRPPKK